MSALSSLSDHDLQRKADGLRNRRDAFSFGSRHADEFVQELAQVTREQERRRDHRTRTAALGIEELELGVRAYNILKRMGVDYLGQLVRVDGARLDAWDRENPDKACGARTRADIFEAVRTADEAIRNRARFYCVPDESAGLAEQARRPDETVHEWNTRMGLA